MLKLQATMAKAKQTKHTAAEIAAKAKASTANKGGGNAGKADRQGGKVGHAKYKCFACGVQVDKTYLLVNLLVNNFT